MNPQAFRLDNVWLSFGLVWKTASLFWVAIWTHLNNMQNVLHLYVSVLFLLVV